MSLFSLLLNIQDLCEGANHVCVFVFMIIYEYVYAYLFMSPVLWKSKIPAFEGLKQKSYHLSKYCEWNDQEKLGNNAMENSSFPMYLLS